MMTKLVILILLAAGVGLFFIKGPNGEPIMTLEDLKPQTSVSDIIPEQATGSKEPAQVYKWQDENGVWQFSNRPADQEGAEVVEYDGNINTVQAYKAPKSTTVATSPAAPIPGVMTVSPQQAGDLMNTVNNLQSTIDQRKADMDAVTSGSD